MQTHEAHGKINFFNVWYYNIRRNVKANTVDTIAFLSTWQMLETTPEKWIPAVVPGCGYSDLL
jgi:sensor histidine kinase YesM